MKRMLTACLACLLLGGCWNRVELNEIGIVSATGVDWKDNKWTLTYQVVIPQMISSQTNSGGGAAPVNVFSTSGNSFRAATKKASQETTRRLYFAHNQMIVIGQEAARHGLEQLFDVYLRNTDSRETVSVFLAKGSARRILEQLIPLEKIPGNAIQRLMDHEDKQSSDFPQMTMHDVIVNLLGSTQAAGIPSLTVGGSNESLDSSDKLALTNAPSKVRLSQLGLINRSKLVGWMSREESFGVMWLRDRIKHTTVSFACGNEAPDTSPLSSVKIFRAKTKLTPVWSGEKWTIRVNMEASAQLMEYSCEMDLKEPDALAKVEHAIESEIVRLMENGWKSVKSNGTDIVGLGNLIHQRAPKLWAKQKGEWAEQLNRMELVISVKVNIQTTGMSGNNFKKAQEQARS